VKWLLLRGHGFDLMSPPALYRTNSAKTGLNPINRRNDLHPAAFIYNFTLLNPIRENPDHNILRNLKSIL
jgi:hypothetical protein